MKVHGTKHLVVFQDSNIVAYFDKNEDTKLKWAKKKKDVPYNSEKFLSSLGLGGRIW